MRKFEKEYLLDRSGIDAVSEEMIRQMRKAGVSRENAIRLRLTMEEVLLRVSKHFDGQITGTLDIRNRMGVPVLRFRYKAESYNPMESADQEDVLTQEILERIGLAPEWGYRYGMNELVLRGPRQNMRQEVRLIIAVLLALAAGSLTGVLPDGLITGLQNYLVDPVAQTFMHALGTFVGLMIFTSIVTGICSVGNVSDFSRMGAYVFRQTLTWSFLGTAVVGICILPFFDFRAGVISGGKSQMDALIEMVYSIIPSNPVSPFADGNMLQIAFIGLMTGVGMLILGEKTSRLQEIFKQVNKLVLLIAGAICKLLPVYIFTSLTVLLWDNGYGIFARLWKPLVLGIACHTFILTFKVVFASIRLHARAGMLFSKIRENVLTGLFTASSSAALEQMLRVNEEKLGIARKFNRFALPLGNMTVLSPTGAVFVVTLYYMAEYYNVPVNTGWLIIAIVLSVIFSLTVPPVSGGMLVCLGLLMAQLGIPGAGLAAGGILCIVLDFFNTAARIGLLHMELAMEAQHLGVLDRETLSAN